MFFILWEKHLYHWKILIWNSVTVTELCSKYCYVKVLSCNPPSLYSLTKYFIFKKIYNDLLIFSANVLGMMPGIKAENWPLGLTNHAYPYGYDPTSTLPITSQSAAVATHVLSPTHWFQILIQKLKNYKQIYSIKH